MHTIDVIAEYVSDRFLNGTYQTREVVLWRGGYEPATGPSPRDEQWEAEASHARALAERLVGSQPVHLTTRRETEAGWEQVPASLHMTQARWLYTPGYARKLAEFWAE